MKRGIKVLGILVVLVVAIAVAGIAVLKSQDFNSYRSLIADAVEDATGRKVVIAGDLTLDVSLKPALSVAGVTFANADWGSRPEMASLDRLAAVVELIPLLSGDIRIEWIEMSGVDVLLETDASGRGNWEFPAAKSGDTGTGSGETRLPVINAVRLADVNLTYRDGVTGTDQTLALDNLQLAAKNLESPLKMSAVADVNGERVEMSGELGPVTALIDNTLFPLRLDVAALGADLTLDGTVNRPRDAKGYNIGFSLQGESLRAVAGRAAALAGGFALPDLSDKAFDLSGAVRDEGKRLAIDGLAVKAGGSDVRGNLSLAPESPRVGLVAMLESNVFDLADIVSFEAPADQGKDDKPLDGRVFPDDPLPFAAIKDIDAEVDLTVQSLTVSNVTVNNTSLGLALAAGKLSLDPLDVSYDGQRVAGTTAIDATTVNPTIVARLSGEGIDYGHILAQTAGNATLKGLMDVNVDLNGRGHSVREIMASLNGDLRVVTLDGRIESGALDFFSGDLLGAVPFLGNKDDARALKCGVIDFAIDDGIAVPRAIVIETGGLNIIGSGVVDLRDETLDLLFDPRAKSVSLVSVAEIGIRVSGTFLEPSFGPDAGSVAKGVASTALGIATGGISTLVEMAADTVTKADQTDYCQAALTGKTPDAGGNGETAPATNKDSRGTTDATQPKAQEPAGQGIGDAVEGVGGALDNLLGN